MFWQVHEILGRTVGVSAEPDHVECGRPERLRKIDAAGDRGQSKIDFLTPRRLTPPNALVTCFGCLHDDVAVCGGNMNNNGAMPPNDTSEFDYVIVGAGSAGCVL